MNKRIYRQGDVVLEEVRKVPAVLKHTLDEMRETGETGQAHVMPGRFFAGIDQVITKGIPEVVPMKVIQVGEGGAIMVHPEHPPMQVNPGTYIVRKVRTWANDRVREVDD